MRCVYQTPSVCASSSNPLLFAPQDMEAKIGHAIKQMHALMPGTDVEAKLHLMGTQYWTFVELL